VKRFLEALGYEVKGEVRGCDVVAVRRGAPDPPLAVELKLAFTLGVVLQGLDRLALTDLVYLAVPVPGPGRAAAHGVALSLITQHWPMPRRNLLYTGVTRGRKLVVLVAQPKAVAIAVKGQRERRRWSKLREWLEPGSVSVTSP